MKICALSGSVRAASANGQLLEVASQVAPAGMAVVPGPLLDGLPHFNPDQLDERLPASVKSFRALLAASDGVLLSSPEYAHGIPGVLKNALDWLVSDVDFVGKRMVIVNVSASEAEYLMAHLLEVLRTMSANVLFSASLRSAHVRQATANGVLDPQSAVADTLRAGLHAFLSA